MHYITDFMNSYSYGVLFVGLMLEVLALPIPGEVIMSYAGLLVFQGKMNWILSMLIAGMGTSIGMTITYWIGHKLGKPFFVRYGARVHLGPERLRKVSEWFEQYGNKVLIIAFFIPGIRHITGYFSGVTRMPFRTYMIYAYSGAFLWTGVFITLGKVLGPKWEVYHKLISRYLIIAGIIALVIFILIYLYKNKRNQIMTWTIATLEKAYKTFHSMGRVKFTVVAVALIFFGFFGLMLGMIQDFLGHELVQFDAVSTYIIQSILSEKWSRGIHEIGWLSNINVLYVVTILTLLWIFFKGKERMLESGFLLFVILGGQLLDEVLRKVFHRLGPIPTNSSLPYTFPSEQTLITLTLYGFSAYLLFRHYGTIWTRLAAPGAVIVIVLLVGINRIYFNIQYPSDVAAGYVFGGVWLSLNIVLLEVFRVLKKEETIV